MKYNIKRFNNNNSGMSLIEISVIVIIVGILAVSATMTMTSVLRANVNRAAETVSSMLDQARMQTMSFEQRTVAVEIFKGSDGYYAQMVNVSDSTSRGEPQFLGNNTVKLYVNTVSGSVSRELDNTNAFVVVFKKNGSVRAADVVGASNYGNISSDIKIDDMSAINYRVISVEGTKTSKVVITPLTGRNHVE